MIERAIVIVLDSVGIGELPDAAAYGDSGSNTLANIAKAAGGLNMPNCARLGLGNIAPILGVDAIDSPSGCYGKMAEKSAGKDTTTGHWEMMGVVTEHPFPVYPHGFPDDVISDFTRRTGRGVLGNKPASGTEIIKELGEEHMRTGKPIVYTSADSVFQIACHEDVIPVEELYNICQIARGMLVFPHNVQRVIARPFEGEPGAFTRTPLRKDFSVEPPSETLLDMILKEHREVIAIGKIEDIFAHRGISTSNHTTNNADGVRAIIDAINQTRGTLIFANLVDFDMAYGHRNDVQGYASALQDFDAALPNILNALKATDALFITADHGCDPTTPSTDHSREYVPVLAYGKSLKSGANLGSRSGFCDLAATLAQLLKVSGNICGESFASDLMA